MTKYLLKVLLLLFSSIEYVYSYSQCPVISNINTCMSEYCFCPKIYDRHLIEYSNGKKCYVCQASCDSFECSLMDCYCPKGYKKIRLEEDCFKCIIQL